jgi:hypothetical protein
VNSDTAAKKARLRNIIHHESPILIVDPWPGTKMTAKILTAMATSINEVNGCFTLNCLRFCGMSIAFIVQKYDLFCKFAF